jgi:allantoate deiminase
MGERIDFQIDQEFVGKCFAELASYGAYGETGIWRTVYSPEWVAAADHFVRWCVEAGLEVQRDAVGNVWGRLEGQSGGGVIATGSHLDSQTPGGRFDGAAGAIAGVIALRTLKERFGAPRRTLECVALCEEESSRFPATGFWGSRAITGKIGPETPHQVRGYADETIAEVMTEIGLDVEAIPTAKRDDIDIFVELHIEQGPILEQADLPVAVVNAITGIRHYIVTLKGVANHAGAFPMDLRRDPMAGFAEIASGVVNTAHRMGRPAVSTVGRITVEPNFPAIVPDRVTFTVDARHPDPAARKLLYQRHEALIREVAERRDLDLSLEVIMDHAPCVCDPDIVATFQEAATRQEIPFMTMPSGAVHDTQQMAEIARVAMLFVRSKDGRSHTPDEFSSTEDLAAGIELLTAGLYELAY